VRTVREDCLNHLLIVSRGHLESVVAEYVRPYSTARPHRGLKLLAPMPRSKPQRAVTVRCYNVLGGVIHEYEHVA
jgi:hypothetical protein